MLTDPPPQVQFLKFADYSLDFRLLVWTREPSRHPQIRSDINYRIQRLFRERGIEIAHHTQEFLLKASSLSMIRDDLIAEERQSVDDSVSSERHLGRDSSRED